MQVGEVDLSDPETFVAGVPHEAFRLLRLHSPVHFQKESAQASGPMAPQGGREAQVAAGRGYWAITKYDDVFAIGKDPHRFSSARGATNIEEYEGDDLDAVRMMMVNMDPPQHGKFRRLVRQGFTPRMVALMEPKIRANATRILDAIAREGTCDFVTSVAARLPLMAIADLLGVPEADQPLLFDWSNRLIGFQDPEFGRTAEDTKQAALEVWMYSNSLAEEREGKDGDDLVSLLVNGVVDGEKLTHMEIDSFFLLLAVAGNETTRNAISGGLLALLEHPDQKDRLVADPSLIPQAVEEMLRWVTPVMYFRRTATEDVVIRGQKIREGDKVCMYYGSANRDEDVFADSGRFDVTRNPNDHVAFGSGEHFCLGASLARLELRIMFEELLKRFPDISVAGPIRRLRSNFINGYKEIPVRFTRG